MTNLQNPDTATKKETDENFINKIEKQISKSQFELIEDYLSENYDFRYNEISNEVESRKKPEMEFRQLNENNIYRELQRGNYKISQANLAVILRSDFVETYNPFKEYFQNLPEWDKETDHIEALANYVKATDQTRFNYQFKKMLVRVVACALIDQVFNKQAFILVGVGEKNQNSGKSTFSRFLCPPTLEDYITEVFSPDKDGQISLSENLFINLDELASLSKYEINQLKSSFSKDKVKIRRPFEKKATTSPRRASFIGSTNKAEFLTDETGSVRWLCFEIIEIDWDYKTKINIDSVWAQAYFLYKENFKYNLSFDDIKTNDQANRKFQKQTPEMELISAKYEPATALNHDKFITPFELSNILHGENSTNYKFTSENVGKALVQLGFERAQKRINGSYPTSGYYIKYKTDSLNTLNIPTTLTTIELSDINDLPF